MNHNHDVGFEVLCRKFGSFLRRIHFVRKNHFESNFDFDDMQSITRVECYIVDPDFKVEDMLCSTYIYNCYLVSIFTKYST
jgi:hypothetical protein